MMEGAPKRTKDRSAAGRLVVHVREVITTTSMLDEIVLPDEKDRDMVRHYPYTTVYLVAVVLALIVIELLRVFVF